MAGFAYPNDINYQYKPNIISFEEIREKKESDNKADDAAEWHGYNSGKPTEVYAFRTDEEIKAMIDVYDKHIKEAKNKKQKQIACRNKMMFIVGINIGVRASDLAELRMSFFFDKKPGEGYVFKKFYKLQPKKQRKTGKFVKLYFNQSVRKAIEQYVAEYPFDSLDDYLFASREGDNKPLATSSIWRIIKRTAKEAGIDKNIGSHSLRKTFGHRAFANASDKNNALVMLQTIFGHNSTAVTARYIGITDDDIEDVFNSINIGLDFI